jgi:hypothetical protein
MNFYAFYGSKNEVKSIKIMAYPARKRRVGLSAISKKQGSLLSLRSFRLPCFLLPAAIPYAPMQLFSAIQKHFFSAKFSISKRTKQNANRK